MRPISTAAKSDWAGGLSRRLLLALPGLPVPTLLHAQAPQPGAAVAPGGRLRAAIITSNPVLVTMGPDGSPGGVTVDLARALAEHLSVPLQIVPYANPARYNESIGKGEWDVGLAARDPAREAVLSFSEPFMEVDGGFVARPGGTIRQAAQADGEGIRIAVAQGSAPDAFLSRSLRQAMLVRIPGGFAPSRDALISGQADLYADNIHICHRIAEAVPGAFVLEGRFNAVKMAIAVPKGNEAALPPLNEFLREAKRRNLITEAIARAGLRGVRQEA
ncbi:transporter substrate-binding domain-containing protein [Sabulicella glaciei]|uniref:Transporter substrate-binding domain-containing protein n=1 Tax=Sabulicella glaciei TaxID=2984948 RepID=A0ABT3NXC5_9PROT|nr:transporter substrate-binding domain-containing protein [Roseococcus sp. MDT2-1-1]MCW8086776.1 transporter substrate-binding domain-containing protein [Roseococcus sp. MDT2-1-1]